MWRRGVVTVVAGALLLVGGEAVAAPNLVVDGGFESDCSNHAVTCAFSSAWSTNDRAFNFVDSSQPNSGKYYAELGSLGVFGSPLTGALTPGYSYLKQTINNLKVGSTYTVDFELAASGFDNWAPNRGTHTNLPVGPIIYDNNPASPTFGQAFTSTGGINDSGDSFLVYVNGVQSPSLTVSSSVAGGIFSGANLATGYNTAVLTSDPLVPGRFHNANPGPTGTTCVDVLHNAFGPTGPCFYVYNDFNFTFTAVAASEPLEFDASDAPYQFFLDDVSVKDPPGPVPEPAPIWLLAVGIIALGIGRARAERRATSS